MVGIRPTRIRPPGGPSAAAANHVPWLRRPRLQHEGRVRRAAHGAARRATTATGRRASPRSPLTRTCRGLPRAARRRASATPASSSRTRGARGGYELASAPETIRMSEVLAALEGPLAPDGLRHRGAPTTLLCDRSGSLHREHPLDPGPRRDRGHPRRHDPRGPRRRSATSPSTRASTARRRAGRQPSMDLEPAPTAHRSRFVTDANDRELVIRDLHVVPAAQPEPRSSRASTSRSARARSTRSWAPTARARPRSATR